MAVGLEKLSACGISSDRSWVVDVVREEKEWGERGREKKVRKIERKRRKTACAAAAVSTTAVPNSSFTLKTCIHHDN